MTRKVLVIVGLASILFCLWSFGIKEETRPYVFPEMHRFPSMPSAKDNEVTYEGVALGRFLFYDKILSEDRTFACATCHKQENAFSDAPNAFSAGIHQQTLTRNTPPLFNLAWYEGLFWDGKAPSVEDQVFHPVAAHNEMNLSWRKAVQRINESDFYPSMFIKAFGNVAVDSVLVAKAIAQFERTLLSHNSKFDKALRGEVKLSSDEYDGLVLMSEQNKGNCFQCHTSDMDALGTTAGFSNNGLDEVSTINDFDDEGRGGVTGNKNDMGLFKIPSIRNLVFTAPYMHDGRFESLEQVLRFYNEGVNNSPTIDVKMTTVHQSGVRLTDEEQAKIISFLIALTDSTFVADKRFSNPW